MGFFNRRKELAQEGAASTPGFIAVAHIRDVRAGHVREFSVGGYKICMTRVGDTFYAFDAFCPHQGWMLWAGEVRGETIRCDKHRWLFNVRTGETLAPADLPVCLPTFAVKVEGEQILVDWDAVKAFNATRETKK